MAMAWRAGPGVTPVAPTLGEGRMGFCEELPHAHQDPWLSQQGKTIF